MLAFKSLFLILLLVNNSYNIPQRSHKGKGCLIIGSNSIQKIYYSSSSNLSKNHDGRKAIDSDIKSSWISKKGGPHWIEIDFGTKRLISKIVIYPGKRDNYNTIKHCMVQFLHNNKWFDFATISLERAKKENWLNFLYLKTKDYKKKAIVDLGGVDTSTFRIFIPEDGTYNGYAAIAEVEAYIGCYRLKYFDERLKGMTFPIKNGFLPVDDSHYPNAPRRYRGGKHVGLDIFYYHLDDDYDPIRVDKNTPVYAAKGGNVIRADWNYQPMTVREWKFQSEYYKKHPRTFVQRSFGGIQVWIDHEDGIVTTYNHLSRIDDKIRIGIRVKKGQRIGWAGNSGLLGEAEGKDYGVHLHFEIWLDGHYLGKGMNIKNIKKYLTWIFSIHQ